MTEDDPGSGYALTSINCRRQHRPSGNRTPDTTARAVTFSIAAGETLNCTFTNKRSAEPSIRTQASGLVTIGEAIHDTATLSGATGDATGTITFNLYSDAECTSEVTTDLQPVDIG